VAPPPGGPDGEGPINPWRWVCECGQSFAEDPTGKGMGRAGSHLATMKRQGNPHRITGMFEADTGERVLEGFDLRGFQELTGRKPPSKRLPDPPPRPSPVAKSGGGSKSGGDGGATRQVRVLVRDVPVTDITQVFFRADVRGLPEAFDPNVLSDDRVYAEEFGRWLEDMVILAHLAYPEQLRFDWFLDLVLQRAGYQRTTEAG